MPYQNECVLRDRQCIDCGECDICDLDESKICDNCCKCIDSDSDYKGIYIDDIMDGNAETEEEDLESTVFDETVTEEID